MSVSLPPPTGERSTFRIERTDRRSRQPVARPPSGRERQVCSAIVSTEQATAADPRQVGDTSPPAGWYVVPAGKGDVVEREWDGDVWSDHTRPAGPDASVARWHRHALRFLRSPGWLLLAIIAVGSVGAFLLARIDDQRRWAEGVQWLAVPLGVAATVAAMASFLLLLDRRLRFGQVVKRWVPIVGWGVASGLVAFGVALGLEIGIPDLFDSSLDKNRGWYFLPGPAEEFAKVLVPVILWFAGRYRLPRQGLVLVLVSAMTFGVLEGGEYAASPEKFQIMRPLGELQHPMYIGFAAAFAWQAAWGHTSWFTRTGVLAVLAAMGLHSLNDGLIGLDTNDTGPVFFITPLVILIAYLLLKHSARQMVPPDNVEHVPPRWRPSPR